jgi:antitoxin VapB
MASAKIFRSGNSQAVRLPKDFRFKSKEVEIYRRGEEVVLREKDESALRLFELMADLPEDLQIADRKKDVARSPRKRRGH